ncbi:MAG: hypothetical protein ACYCS8_00825 [Acidithiobacillus sp.]|uniref:hypothetical protein n=1 Tax=Acidithiobacillus ferrooxidans TaxID=920 RepID=UPI000AC2693C|nr:hypothetical protein [Acidithiobacillus ferrooxidans]
MIPRLYHKGTLAAEAGVIAWVAALGVSGLRMDGYPISPLWIAAGLIGGFLLMVWGITWEMRVDLTPVSEKALTTLHWFGLHCPYAADLLQRKPHPTWAEAFHVEEQCRKRANSGNKGDHS